MPCSPNQVSKSDSKRTLSSVSNSNEAKDEVNCRIQTRTQMNSSLFLWFSSLLRSKDHSSGNEGIDYSPNPCSDSEVSSDDLRLDVTVLLEGIRKGRVLRSNLMQVRLISLLCAIATYDPYVPL